MPHSNAFSRLDERIQRYIWSEGWESLRDAQEIATPLILGCDRDVIIAAATAAGKTEAAFLPALTHLLSTEPMGLIVYISPLKALINDQFGRLERLCEKLEVPVWPWHGDVSATTKRRFLGRRAGVLLITPESLEAQLCNRGTSVKSTFERLTFLIVDELHAFIGSERGKQLQSLMHRIERAIGRQVPRIALSATLGDMNLAADFLRGGLGDRVALVESRSEGQVLKIAVKGYEEPSAIRRDGAAKEPEPHAPAQIARHLLSRLRGSNNLVFPNSRREVERYTHLLNRMCEEQQVPSEFWPHHGSLSKEIRAEAEAALKHGGRPATAICTNTLELGIDIGAVKSVSQIGPPCSVASLRQRLGRSGRRKGEAAILRGYCIENALSRDAPLSSELRLGTVQTIAMIDLLLEGWFEPPRTEGLHLSTLVQQMLSHISQMGGASIGQLYGLLCKPGSPFEGLTPDDFKELVQHLGEVKLLIMDSSGTLLHGEIGEKLVNHYTFYAAFESEEEFRIECDGKPLGTLPVSQALTKGQFILFAGKTWCVEAVDSRAKIIVVTRTLSGTPPIFSGDLGLVHTVVRQRMRHILESGDIPEYLDDTARRLLYEGRQRYRQRGMAEQLVLDLGRHFLLLTWLGDTANAALAALLCDRGFRAQAAGIGVEVQRDAHSISDIRSSLLQIGAADLPPLEKLLANMESLECEKWDWTLPRSLLLRSYASLRLNLQEAVGWAASSQS